MTEHRYPQRLGDALSEAVAQAIEDGETAVSLDAFVSVGTGPTGETQILASPAPSADRRRASGYRPTVHLEMTVSPVSPPDGLQGILGRIRGA